MTSKNPSMTGLSAHQLIAHVLDAAAAEMPALYSLLGEWSRRVVSGAMSEADFLCVLYALKVRQGLRYDPQVVAAIARGMRRQLSVPDGVLLHDNSGTGGGTQKTVNISSAAALVVAAAGIPVVKHGFKGVTSGCGSRDGLMAVGIDCSNTPEMALEEAMSVGISYVDFHISVRWEFRYPTYSPLNEVGPLSHPLPLHSKVIGTSDLEYFKSIRECLSELGIPRVVLIFNPRIDELDLWTPSQICDVVSLNGGTKISETQFDPSVCAITRPDDDKWGAIGDRGSPEENWRLVVAALSGERKCPADLRKIIAANAGVSLWAHGMDTCIESGIERSMSILRAGKAMDVLEKWRKRQHDRLDAAR
jgi:anthranilate phosphoribosyltransferase